MFGNWKIKRNTIFLDGWAFALLSKGKKGQNSTRWGSNPRSLEGQADVLTITPPGPQTRPAPLEIFIIYYY
jgi:hypothetical protein